jgi:hypothetical protein
MDAHVPDFIQEDRTATGVLEQSEFSFSRIGKGARLITEEFALQERAGNGGTVDIDKGFRVPVALAVDRTGD